MPVENISRDPQGNLEMVLTSDAISYEGFPRWCREFLKRYGGDKLKEIDGPDCRVQRVRLLGQELELVFCDYPVQTSLLAKTPQAEIALHAIEELEKRKS